MNSKEYEALKQRLLKHQIYLSRYAKRLGASTAKWLKNQTSFITAEILATLEKIEGLQVGPAFNSELKKLNDTLIYHLDDNFEPRLEELKVELTELIKAEEAIYFKIANQGEAILFKTLRAESAKKIIQYTPYAGRTLDKWFETTFSDTRNKIMSVVNAGMMNGASIDEIVKQVKGTKALNYKDGILDDTDRHIQTVVRTTALGVANQTRAYIHDLNSDIIDGEIYVATLDSKTTLICASLDNKIFPLGSGPRPPLHPNCRSLRVPYFDDIEITDEKRSSINGSVSQKMNFEEFLKGQPKDFQDEYLGKEKAEMFRAGKVSLGQMVDQNGRGYTLKELKKLYEIED